MLPCHHFHRKGVFKMIDFFVSDQPTDPVAGYRPGK